MQCKKSINTNLANYAIKNLHYYALALAAWFTGIVS
jgi:hypothetical protein